MDNSDKEAAESAVMELDAQISDTLSPLRSAIVQRSHDEFEERTSDVEELANNILEIAESDGLTLWTRYTSIIIEDIDDLRDAFHDNEYEQASNIVEQIHDLSLYELRQRDLYDEE